MLLWLCWSSSVLCFFLGIRSFFAPIQNLGRIVGFDSQQRILTEVVQVFREIEETLAAGLVPHSDRWDSLRNIAEPWGTLATDSLLKLRAAGGSLLPTLKRLRALAEDQSLALKDAKAKSAQAFAQAIACASLVPILGWGLYAIIPAIEEHSHEWTLACGGALVLSGTGSLWLLKLAEAARWGGLAPSRRSWILAAQCAGERFLALIRCGTPPDLAWSQMTEPLLRTTFELGTAWGPNVWQSSRSGKNSKMDQTILDAGYSIKKAIQVSLMEGRPCTERVEAALLALQQEMRAHIERELNLLSTRALKPLFVCVAPALLGLLFYGLWLTAQESLGGSFTVS